MRFKGTKLSNRTVALFAAAILLLSSGGFMGAKALPNVQGQNYDARIELDSISVQLLENGEEPEEGILLASLKNAKPGMKYKEDISVRNNGTAAEYVRLVVRKYWTKDGETVKDTNLTPDLIKLELTGDWKENPKEATDEMSVLYYTKQVAAGDSSQAIKSIQIDRSIMDEVKIDKESTTAGDETTTTITYTYKYDGYAFNIEAEAQAVQTHNANDAIKSIWGVDNVTASGNSLSVK